MLLSTQKIMTLKGHIDMKTEKNYAFQRKLLRPHPVSIYDTRKLPAENQLVLKNNLTIELSEDCQTVATTAAQDFADYLRTAMNLSGITLKRGLTDSKNNTVKIHPVSDANAALLGEANRYKGYCIITDNSVEIYAHDECGTAQALYHLEDVMSLEHAPFLAKGTEKQWPMFSPQMVHSGYALDDYPEEYLSYIAHEGRDAILVFTKDVDTTPSGYLDFNQLIDRAAKYGIDVYAYSYMISNMSPESEEAYEFYDNSYGRLFRQCPGLKGVVLVGESVEFPSRDPHVAKGRYFEIDPDGIPSGKVSSGWYPCEDYPVWLSLLQRVIYNQKPEADIVFWTYNWGFQPEEARIKLIEALPENITLLATFEMFEPKAYGSHQAHCADYTLSFEGPGQYFKSEAIAAKKRGIKLYSMTNTGGLTWDFGVIPYEPMPYQWLRRYDAIRKAADDFGLSGLMESHHYGFYPSFISKLAKLSFTEPRRPLETLATQIIKGTFGEENFENTNAALKLWSDAIRFYTPTDADQYGAFRVGPAYPFCLTKMVSLPSSPNAMFGNSICACSYSSAADYRDSLLSLRLPEEIKSLENMRDMMAQGIRLLEEAPIQNEELADLTNLGSFILRSVITGINAKKWYRYKCRLAVAESKEEAARLLDEMEQLLNLEKENAQKTIPLVEADSRLGWEPSMLYMTDRTHLEWKIRQVDSVLNVEMPAYRKSLTK